MISLTEKELFEIFREANRILPEEELEFSMILSGKCRIEGRTFQAPSLGTFLLLEEWKSPFAPGKVFRGENGTAFPGKLCAEDLHFALFLLENGREGALLLMEERAKNFFSRGRKKVVRKGKRNVPPPGIRGKLAARYARMDWKRAAEELSAVLSFHSATAMLPDGGGMGRSGTGTRPGGNVSPMEEAMGILVFAQEKLPSLPPEKILWDLPFAFLAWLFVLEARKNEVPGIGREETSRTIWKHFSQHLSRDEKPEKCGSENKSVPPALAPGEKRSAEGRVPADGLPREKRSSEGRVLSDGAIPGKAPATRSVLPDGAPVDGRSAKRIVLDRISPEKALGKFSRILQESERKNPGREGPLPEERIVSLVRQCVTEILPSDSV
ncbi:MAG: hypothetical protein J6331_10330 [Lentisphaeria bacterium]|nr:hypothetical protein [Lentisphaeria bacterium]